MGDTKEWWELETIMAKALVFSDQKQNRFMFPCYIWENEEDVMDGTDRFYLGLSMRTATGIELEEQLLEFDIEKIPHVRGELLSRGFQHGAATAYFISGPEFDAVAKEMENGSIE